MTDQTKIVEQKKLDGRSADTKPNVLNEQQREALIIDNQGLVHFIAKKYTGNNVSYGDLVSAGTIGLIQAIDKYDPEKGALSTYAVYWIELLIREELYRDTNIRPPLAHHNMFRSIYKRAIELEIFDVSDKSIRKLRKDKEVTRIMSGYTYSKKTIWKHYIEWYNFNPNTLSADKQVDEAENKSSFLERIPDSYSKSTEDYVEDRVYIEQLLQKLTDKERYVIEQYYFHDKTLKEIAGDLGVREQRTAQIRTSALNNLKQIAERLN